MHRFELVLSIGGHERERFAVGAKGLIIGRAADSDVVLSDMQISRQHARVHLDGEGVRVEDLGSRNGIQLDGQPTPEGMLAEGGQLRIGDYVFLLVRATAPTNKETTTFIPPEQAGALQEQIIGEATARTSVLYRAAKLMGTVFDLDELLREFLQLCFDCLPARRGFVLTMPEDELEPEVHASIVHDGTDESLPLSRTLIDHVFQNESAILTQNAQEDIRFDTSESIMHHHIHSAMCAPLCGRHEAVVGAIYLDSGSSSMVFNQEHLELLTALGRVVGVAVENARLYQENVQRERLAAIGEATTGLGHCVKNILQGIKSGGEYIDMGLEKQDIEWITKGWPMVRTASDRIEGLMMNLLTISRERRPDLSPNDLNGICKEVVSMLIPRAEKAGIALDFRPGQTGTVYCDGREIFRVMLNLVTNAVEACEGRPESEIILTTYRKPSGVFALVKDNGPGIVPEIRPRLGQAFITTKGSGGTGLGLACSFKIVREHGGDLQIDSDLGQGTRITMFLPTMTMVGQVIRRS